MSYTAGDMVLLDYDEVPRLWHMRFLVFHVQTTEYIVVTPDFDIYVEDISLANPDLVGVRSLLPGGAFPLASRVVQCTVSMACRR